MQRPMLAINQDGESKRFGFHPIIFCQTAWRNSNTLSKWLYILWPFVPAAIASHWVLEDRHVTIFVLCYIAMIPAANMLSFAGQEFARKLPLVYGILVETSLGSVVEIILFMILTVRAANNYHYVAVLHAAILGSIMTNLLLCLGLCFLVGGIKKKAEQRFHSVVGETGSGSLLVAGFALLVPSAFYSALYGLAIAEQGGEDAQTPRYTVEQLDHDTRGISHGTSIILIIAFISYTVYCARPVHDAINDILSGEPEAKDNRCHRQRESDWKNSTSIVCVVAIVISIACVTLVALFLVEQIHYIVEERHIPEAFLGFILVPLVEKLAEHITTIDEAYNSQINSALYHCICPSIQTALFNAPLTVIVSWCLGSTMDLKFEIFMVVILVLSILVVGNFLRDGSSNFLEGALLIVVYAIIALATWYYPDPTLTAE